MKKIFIIIIILFAFSILGIKTVGAQELSSYWLNYEPKNIKIENNQIEINKLIINEYYLIQLKTSDDNVLDLKLTNEVNANDNSFKTYSKNSNINDYSSYNIFKAEKKTYNITLPVDNNYKITVLYKTYINDVLKIDSNTSIADDFNILNVKLSFIKNEYDKLITLAYGNSTNLKIHYAYVYSNTQLSDTGYLNFTAENDVKKSVSYTLQSKSNSIYKLELDIFDNFLENNDSFIFESVTSNSVTKSSNNYLKSTITYLKKDNKIYYAAIEQMKSSIKASYNFYDIPNNSNIFGYFTDKNVRLHYLLFDWYLDDSKVDSSYLINKVTLNYNYNYYLPATWSAQTKKNVNEQIEKKGMTHLYDKVNRTETITTRDETIDVVARVNNPLDFINNILANKKDTYKFKTLSRFDDTTYSEFDTINFKNYDYAMYFMQNEDYSFGDYGYDLSFYQFELTDLLFPHTSLIKNAVTLPRIVSDINFLTIDFEYQGITYTANIDSTNVSYDGQSDDFIGEYVPGENKISIFDIAGITTAIIVIILIIAFVVILIFAPQLIPVIVNTIVAICKFIYQALKTIILAIVNLIKSIYNSIKSLFTKNKKSKKTKKRGKSKSKQYKK